MGGRLLLLSWILLLLLAAGAIFWASRQDADPVEGVSDVTVVMPRLPAAAPPEDDEAASAEQEPAPQAGDSAVIDRQPPPPPSGGAQRDDVVSSATARPPGPDPALLERTSIGELPRIGPDGRLPRETYARPFGAEEGVPRIAILIGPLGLARDATQSAIQQLPGAVSLAFAPYVEGLEQWTQLARVAGHEVFLSLPMEPQGYPDEADPGPQALLTGLTAAENRDRLEWVMTRARGYAGLATYMGEAFLTAQRALTPVIEEIGARGLMLATGPAVPGGAAAELGQELGVPVVTAALDLDAEVSRRAVDARLAELEDIARENGVAVAVGDPYPVTIERIAHWAREVEMRGVVLAPVTALAGQ